MVAEWLLNVGVWWLVVCIRLVVCMRMEGVYGG